ncbi:MAG: hypothetical protein IE931_08400 [Sphingobacteriales bacterium]|nr:hypothetical protein [Sphingobacteriales bacterium]
MKKLSTFIFFFIVYQNVLAQLNSGSRLTALGNASVAMEDVWSATANQAGLAALAHPEIAAAYENRFGLQELSTKSAVFAIPIKNYVLATSFISYGVESYSESKSSLSLARKLGPKLHLALALNYHQLRINQYGNAKSFSFEAGVQYQLNKSVVLASHIANPNQSEFGNLTEEVIPAHIQFGMSYWLSKQLIICTEIEKILDKEVDFKSGLEYQIADFLALRGGLNMNPFKQYFGFGLNYQQVKLDFALSSHPTLGYSPQISLGYVF